MQIVDDIENPNSEEPKVMGDCWSDKLDGYALVGTSCEFSSALTPQFL